MGVSLSKPTCTMAFSFMKRMLSPKRAAGMYCCSKVV
jgi:hypothetical protein